MCASACSVFTALYLHLFVSGGIIMCSLLKAFQAMEWALAASNSSSPAYLCRELTNWLDNNLFLFPSRCLSLFPSDPPPWLSFFSFLFISSPEQLLFLNILSHDQPRGILVVCSNSPALSDPPFIWYFCLPSSLHCPNLPLFSFTYRTLCTSPQRVPQGAGEQVIYIAHHNPSPCVHLCHKKTEEITY